MGRQWNSLCQRKNICSKQSEITRADPIRKSWSSRCRISRITANTWVNQEELLVARDKRQCQEICLRI